VFSRDPGGHVTALHLGVQPLSLQKRPDAQHPRPWVAGALAASAVALATGRRQRAPGGCHQGQKDLNWTWQRSHDEDRVSARLQIRQRGHGREQQLARWTRVRPIMNEILQHKGLAEVAEGKVRVTDVKGPLEEGWQHKVEAFAARIPIQG
jgi:hypothetical protein